MKIIKLNKKQFDYIITSKLVPQDLLTIVKNSDVDHANAHIFRVSTETADTFRDLFGDRLQLQGFDENYNLTAEGAILEDLIDEFYCK